MTENELVKGFQEAMKDGIDDLVARTANLRTLSDIEKLQKRLQAASDDVKIVLNMFENYLMVQKYYGKHIKNEEAQH